MNEHDSNIVRTCYFELRRLAFIRRFLTSTATAILVSSFVLSRSHYCNSLLFVFTHDVTSHMQQIKNYAARVMMRIPKSDNIATHIRSLILTFCQSKKHNIVCSYYHWYSSTAALYDTDMLQRLPSHSCDTRSNSHTTPLLNRPACCMATLGDRSF